MYIQASLLTTPTDRSIGMVRYSTARTTSPTIMFIRRSNRSATAPASGPSTSAGNSEMSHTPPTAKPCSVAPRCPVRSKASDASASRLSQSPRLDSDSAIHSLRNGLIDSTLPRPLRKGDVKFTALGYRQIALRSCHRFR